MLFNLFFMRPAGSVSRKPGKKRSKLYLANKEKARALVTERLRYFNQFYDFSWKRVSIKDTKRRWGSCSKKGNLNFCYKVALLPPEVADYIVVHELCHLGQFNHSRDFWGLVAKTIPEYKQLRLRLTLGLNKG
jgi:hypothetical protein